MLPRLLALALIASVTAPAVAFPPFKSEFVKKYAKSPDEAFNKLAKKAGCHACHQGKKKGDDWARNPYGSALGEYLGKADTKDKEKVQAMLDKVADQSSNPDDPNAPTFGELIAAGELPGGSIEDCKKSPEERAGSGSKGSGTKAGSGAKEGSGAKAVLDEKEGSDKK